MKFTTHMLMGLILAFSFAETSNEAAAWLLFSVLPDLPQILIYPYLGNKYKRRFFIPHDIDWYGFSESRMAAYLNFAPHTFWAWVIIGYLYGPIAIVAYGIHLLLDWPAHTGEWALRPLWPFSYTLEGFYDGWKIDSWNILKP